MIMGRNLFSTEEILKLPVTTNKLSVTWDGGALFQEVLHCFIQYEKQG